MNDHVPVTAAGLNSHSAPALFQSLRMRALTLPNRIVVSPMCQYSAIDGNANDWHVQHLSGLALSGAGLLMIEATAVSDEGRITHGCLGLYTDDNEEALGRVLASVRKFSQSPIGIQIAHAGRKGSAQRPWEGAKALNPSAGAWATLGPSPTPYGRGWHTPGEMTKADMTRILEGFGSATRRAARLGLEVLELHGAHGYLIHQFLSPLSNQRADSYGGSYVNRMRFPLQVVEQMRAHWPQDRPLGVRISGSDWMGAAGLELDDAVLFAKELCKLGVDYVCVSSGGLTPEANIVTGPNYQVGFAARVRAETGMVTRAVGLIARAEQANAIVASGQADLVALARAFIDDPRWAWHAAQILGSPMKYPPQYERGHPDFWTGAATLRSGSSSSN